MLTKKGKALDFEPDTVVPKKIKSAYMCFLKEWFDLNKDKNAGVPAT